MRRLPGFFARCDVFQASSKRLPTFPCIVATRYAARAYNGFAPSACGPRAVRKIVHNVRIKTPKEQESIQNKLQMDMRHSPRSPANNIQCCLGSFGDCLLEPLCKCKPMGVQTGRGFE